MGKNMLEWTRTFDFKHDELGTLAEDVLDSAVADVKLTIKPSGDMERPYRVRLAFKARAGDSLERQNYVADRLQKNLRI